MSRVVNHNQLLSSSVYCVYVQVSFTLVLVSEGSSLHWLPGVSPIALFGSGL